MCVLAQGGKEDSDRGKRGRPHFGYQGGWGRAYGTEAKLGQPTRHCRACPGDLDQKGTVRRLSGWPGQARPRPGEPPRLLPLLRVSKAILLYWLRKSGWTWRSDA